jgi:hypothetical protein
VPDSVESTPIPLTYKGDGKFEAPTLYWRVVCDGKFSCQARYVFTQQQERSWKSHKHYFASINEAWSNMPEKYAGRYPSPDHLRKEALVACGYYDQREFVCKDHNEALKLAKWLRSDKEMFAIIAVHGPSVVERRPKSQSQRAMGKAEFQQSKDDVMAYCWNLVGVDPSVAAGEVGSNA